MSEMVCRGLVDDTVCILIGGEAGQGITRSGGLLGHAFVRSGFHVFGTNEYPSLIRGGHNYYLLRISSMPVYAHSENLDILIALNKETALLHEAELNQDGCIIVDESTVFAEGELERKDVKTYKVPMASIVKELGGPDIMRNTVALGAAVGLLNFDKSVLGDVVAATFSKPEVAEINLRALDRGYKYVKENYLNFNCEINGSEKNDRILITGNHALALGAVSAGLRFYAAYPMTPASPILDWMITHEAEAGLVVIQSESELAAINMAIGASYTGVRAMTGTSGGGFSLMTEGLGLAAMSECPIVVNIGQRPGPSTGLATHSSQADLLFAIHSSQGEFPRVVVAPGDQEECFQLTKQSFNLAEKFQIPVLILTDKYLAESERDVKPFDYNQVPIDRGKTILVDVWNSEYRRYSLTEDGVSPRLLPGTKGAIINATSNEHKDTGYTTSNPKEVVDMVNKRFRKIPLILEEVDRLSPVKVYGIPDAEVTLVGWGGNKGPLLEAIRLLEGRGIKARFVQVVFLEPFPIKSVKEELRKTRMNILFESNVTAQLGQLIKTHVGYIFDNVGLRYDGRPFSPVEINHKVLEVLRK